MTEGRIPRPELEVEHAHYQKLLDVQKKVARALNNMPTSDVLYVLADLVKSILDAQEAPRRKKNCDAFVKMISPSPSVIVMTDEYGRKKQ
jgi:hypothetical protein